MNYKETLNLVANKFEKIILEETNGTIIPTEDFGWDNRRFISDVFRIAHIERYSDNNLEVLHFTCFPSNVNPEPIFGFDIITTPNKCLAAFLDWSPVISNDTYVSPYDFKTPYKLPEWAKEIFSKDAIAIVPNDEEFDIIANIAIRCFESYIELLSSAEQFPHLANDIKNSQNRYCENQQKNERTYNVLKAKLGEAKAKEFMTSILFPMIY
jgi:phycocyanobilin:ferredoxin oxidoreductase